MAGSYMHCTNDDGTYRGPRLCENLGDCYEAIEEMWFIIQWLAEHTFDGSTPPQGYEATAPERIQRASDEYFRCLRGEQPWPASMRRAMT